MKTKFVNSPDGIQLAYDQQGTGPAIILVHGGGSDRQVWHEIGYIERLHKAFTVITFDLRGHGESSLPTDPEYYTSYKMGEDILTVASACGVEKFILWGMSYGGKVNRYVASRSNRVEKCIIMGIPMGPGVTDKMRQDIEDFCEHWTPILGAQSDGMLEPYSLSEEDREFLRDFNVPVIMAWGQAMLHWKSVEPADFLCPTLWLIGSEDQPAMDSFGKYEKSLKGSNVQYHIFEGLNHVQVLEEIDKVFPVMLAFTQK